MPFKSYDSGGKKYWGDKKKISSLPAFPPPHVFKRPCSQYHQNSGLFGKGKRFHGMPIDIICNTVCE